MNDEIEIRPQVISPLKKICMTIGELPTSYLETMTYYEMLVWFTNYLRDTVIPVVNNNGEAVTELQNLFIELQSYVNDYFDNLDVQEEINNKLDEMLDDGVLEQIIEQFLQLTSLICFDNVADMKDSVNLANGSYAKTLGYYSKNDGGQALYKIRTITNDDIVNDMTIIAVHDNSLIAELIIEDEMNIKCFGAIGNGTDDDSDKLQFALNTTNIICNHNNTYKITKTITVSHSLNGNDSTFTIPQYGQISNLNYLGVFIVNTEKITVKNCKFVNSYTTYTDKIPYVSSNVVPPILSFVDGSDGSSAISCSVTNTNGHSIQVYGNTVKNILIENCKAIGCGCGVGIEEIANGSSTPKNITINNFYSECNNSCEITSGSGISVNNCYFESNGTGRGVVTTNEAYHDTHVTFNGCTFKHTGTGTTEADSRCILIDSYGVTKNVFVTLTSCNIDGDHANMKTISLSDKCKATLVTCDIKGQILLRGTSHVNIINSTLAGSVHNGNIIILEQATAKCTINECTMNVTSPTAGIWTKGQVDIYNSILTSDDITITYKDTSKGVILNSTLSKLLNIENLYGVQFINSKFTNDTRFFTNLGTIIGAVNTTADLANIPASVSNLAMVMLVTSKKVVYKYGTSWYYLDGTLVS